MKIIDKLGKSIFSVPLIVFGLFHFTNAEELSSMVPDYLPYDQVWVYATGLALVLAAIAILSGKKARLASVLLGTMLLLFALLIHLPSVLGGNENSMGMLLKDLSLAGASLVIAANSKN